MLQMVNKIFAAAFQGFEFDIRLTDAKPHFYSTESGQDYATFIFIMSGRIDISSGKRNVKAHTGEFFCIPPRMRCRGMWSCEGGAENVQFYSLHLTEKPGHCFFGDFSLMKLPEFSNDDTLARIEEIFYSMQGSELEKIRAMARFTEFCCDLKPMFDCCPHPKLSQPLAAAVAILESDFVSEISVAELAEKVHISQSGLFKLFRNEIKQTPISYRNELRIAEAVRLLEASDLSICEISERVGFETLVHFRNVFKQLTGASPREYRRIVRGISQT